MKILYVTAEGFDTPNPNNQMAETMILAFLKNGYSVHLVQSHRKGVNPDIPTSLLGTPGFSYDIVNRKVVGKTNFVRRYLNDVAYAFQSMKYWKKIKDADIVYLQSNPATVFSMLLLKLFIKVPIVYSIYDIFPGHAYDVGVIKSRFVYSCLKLIQKPCYKMASIITVLSDDMKNKVVKLGAGSSKVRVVPAWFDDRNVREVESKSNRFIEKYHMPTDKFYVQFAGTIGYVFNYKAVISLAEKLKDIPAITIQIVGDGSVKSRFASEAESKGLGNITLYPLQPIEIVPDVYSACDVCLIPLMRGVIGNGVPSKVPILMACRRAIVNSVELDSMYARMFTENDMGVSVEIDDIDGLAQAIMHLYRHPEDIDRMADNAFRFGQEHYSSALSTEKLMRIFEELGAGK